LFVTSLNFLHRTHQSLSKLNSKLQLLDNKSNNQKSEYPESNPPVFCT